MRVDALAEVLQRPLPDPADEVRLHVGGRPVDRCRGEERNHDQSQCVQVAVRRWVGPDSLVDRQAGEVGGSERRRRGEDERHHHPEHADAVGPEQAEQPADLAAAIVIATDRPPDRLREQPGVAEGRPRLALASLVLLALLPVRCLLSVVSHLSSVLCPLSPRQSRATSSRSSRSRCRKARSARPWSAISR